MSVWVSTREIIAHQGGHFINETSKTLVWEFVIKHQKSTTYYPRCNGQAKSTNKTLKTILMKMVQQQPSQKWDLNLKTSLWAYRTAYKVIINQNPFRLVYGHQQAVVPLEFMPSLRVAVVVAKQDLDYNQILRVRLEKLSSLDELRQKAIWSQKVV